MKRQTVHILTLMVDNEFGVLTRITAQIRREGWNIKSLAVAESQEPSISRITLAMECFDTTLPTVLHRLTRLACVRSVTAFEEEKYVCRELMVARVAAAPESVERFSGKYGARILKKTGDAVILEWTGTPGELNEGIAELEALGDVRAARTGPIALEI